MFALMIYNCPSVTRGLIKVAGLVEIIPFFFFLSFLFPNSLSREPNNGLSCLTSEDDLTDANFSKPHKSLTLVHLSFLEIASSFSQVELLGQEQTLCSSEIPYCTCWNPKTWRQMLPPWPSLPTMTPASTLYHHKCCLYFLFVVLC